MKKRAFTFVEILVVVFVLCVIAAIMFPILSSSRENAHKSTCQSNLKQLALGFKQYTQDYNERFPSIFKHPAPVSSACMVCDYGWGDALQPYVKSTQIFQCPDRLTGPPKTYKPWQAGYSDYYYNTHVSGTDEKDFANSANIVLLGEGNDGIDTNDARYNRSFVPVRWSINTNSPIYFHLEGCNYAFVDGHVKWLKFDRHPTTERANGSNFTFSP